MKKCPYCAEEIQDEAIVCKHCGRDLVAPAQPKPDRLEQAKQLAEAEAGLAKLEADLREHERAFNSEKNGKVTGGIIVLIGVLGFLFLTNWWLLWVILLLGGGLTFLQSSSNQGITVEARKKTETEIAAARAKIVELRALLLV